MRNAVWIERIECLDRKTGFRQENGHIIYDGREDIVYDTVPGQW